VVATVPLLALGVLDASAMCRNIGGFAIFQCGDSAFFAPLPAPVTLDPNGTPTNISATFWQIGFGNRTLTFPPSPPGSFFPGNDAGHFPVGFSDARLRLQNFQVPVGATCLASNNWGDFSIDGCPDDARDPSLGSDADVQLNPFFATSYYGHYGVYSLDAQQDYPMAVLLKGPAAVVACNRTPTCDNTAHCSSGPRAGTFCKEEEDCDYCSGGEKANGPCENDADCADTSAARYFAIAAVATWDRGNDGTGNNGPCAPEIPGTNPGPCYVGPGWYLLKDVNNGDVNPIDGRRDVVPWQEAPTPQLACAGGCSSSGPSTIDASWGPVRLFHDGSIRPSTNPTLGPADPTRANGVGVLDVAAKFPLIRYQLESAPVTCANVDPNAVIQPSTMTWSILAPETPDASLGGLTISPDTCVRVRVLFGKKPETTITLPTDCRMAKCGDIGYDSARVDSESIQCVGGSIVQGPTGRGVIGDDGHGGSVCNPASSGPSIGVSVSPSVLWPPSHQMIAVHATVTATASSGTPAVTLESIVSSEPDDAPGGGDGKTVNDIQGADVGTADFDFLLRAERDGGGPGRVYTITYKATDSGGRTATAAATLLVPHDESSVVEPMILSARATPSGTLISWSPVPGAQHYDVIRGDIAQIGESVATIDLGAVTCIAGGVVATSTAGFEDAAAPPPGRAFFYAVEYLDGIESTYGTPDASKPRVPVSGACP
jgi:hypothetical protein